jgi:hypothetical protein
LPVFWNILPSPELSQAWFVISKRSSKRSSVVQKYTKPANLQGLEFLIICLLGVIVEFISVPVVAGFVSAAAFIIIASQLKTILGLAGIHGEDLVSLLYGVIGKIGETNLSDLTMALCSIALLVFLQVSGTLY